MKTHLAILPFLIGSSVGLANSEADISAIVAMSGCHEVGFDFQEFETAEGATPSPDYSAQGLELVYAERLSENRISLQHILAVGPGIFIKHWRQEWEYQAKTGLNFIGFDTWQQVNFHPTQGEWVQKVYQVDDGPRYECSAPWIHGATSTWSCNSWAPLPRREFSQRDDYQVMDRGNTHEVLPSGSWLHRQVNEKLVVDEVGGEASWIATELGLNSYKKVDMSRCEAAVQWWQGVRADGWKAVQAAWNEVFTNNRSFTISGSVALRGELARLVEEQVSSPSPLDFDEVKALALTKINSFLILD